MTRQAAERRGRWGETVAAWWLRLHGWRILAFRVKLRVGEVDLVAKRGRTVAFIEVKLPGEGRSKSQIAWHDRALKLGHAVAVVDDVAQALDFVRQVRAMK